MQLVGTFYAKLFKLFNKQDGLTIGEKLALLDAVTKDGLRYASDKELYDLLEKVIEADISDEPVTEEEWIIWIAK
jgi:hypothetical protein